MIRLERREHISLRALLLALAIALACTLGVAALLVLLAGAPVGQVFWRVGQGGFGSVFAWSETLTRAVPLMLTGLAVALAFRARFFNIGAEGQFYAGAMAAVLVGGVAPGAELWGPPWLVFISMLAAAMLAGALLLMALAWLKWRHGVDEVVTTLLMNFVILLAVSALLDGPMKDPSALGWPQSLSLDPELELARPLPGMRLHTGLAWALGAAVLMWVLLRHSLLGFAITAQGASASAAAFAGVSPRRALLSVALLSGALAGLAGALEVAGRTSYVTLDMSPGYGYSGIVVAVLAGLHPLGVVAVAVLVAGLQVGADSTSRALAVPTYLSDVVVATALLTVLVALSMARYRWRRVGAQHG